MNHGNQIFQENLVPGEIIALWATFLSIGISLISAYNESLRTGKIEGEPFFDFRTEQRLILVSKLVILITIIYFLYVAYINYKNKDKHNNIEDIYLLLQLISALLVFVASIITTYVVLCNYNENESLYENPEI